MSDLAHGDGGVRARAARAGIASPVVCTLAFFALACRASAGDAQGDPEVANVGASQGAVTRPEPSQADTLRLRLDVPGAVSPGEPVPIRLQVENVSGRRLELHLRGREIAFDITVSEPSGATVWRRLDEAVVPGILGLEPLAPGGSLTLSDSWDQRSNDGAAVPPGAYMVRGALLTDGEPLTTAGSPLRITRSPSG